MTKYLIQSDRLGKIGDVFEPAEGINVDALLDGGFISTEKKTKSPKVEIDQKEK